VFSSLPGFVFVYLNGLTNAHHLNGSTECYGG